MSEQDKTVAAEMEKYLPYLDEYDRGRLVGIGEGLAMNVKAKEAEADDSHDKRD